MIFTSFEHLKCFNKSFSIWLELSTSETWIRDVAVSFYQFLCPNMNTLSISHYVPRSYIDRLHWGNSCPFFSLLSKSLLNFEHNFSLPDLINFFLNFIVTCFWNPFIAHQLEKTCNSLVSICAKKYGCSTH